jgi:hypothetical protein
VAIEKLAYRKSVRIFTYVKFLTYEKFPSYDGNLKN